jgi:hypothetical protein
MSTLQKEEGVILRLSAPQPFSKPIPETLFSSLARQFWKAEKFSDNILQYRFLALQSTPLTAILLSDNRYSTS